MSGNRQPRVAKGSCPFCQNPEKSEWHFDGKTFVVADDADRVNTLILFPHEHQLQNWLKERKEFVENLTSGIARARWGRDVKCELDWQNRGYEHAHLQLIRRQ